MWIRLNLHKTGEFILHIAICITTLGTINSPVGKYDRYVNLTRKEVNQIKAQEQQRAKEAALERYNDHH